MSSNRARPAHRDPASLLALGIGALIVGAVIFFAAGSRQTSLHRSQVGFAGLAAWLDSQQIETLTFTGGGALRAEDIGLRILPLFDTDLLARHKQPQTDAEILQQKTEFDISRRVVWQKIELAPTLVVLPKWRRAVRTRGIAHPAYLIPQEDVRRVEYQISTPNRTLHRPSDAYSETAMALEGKRYDVGLYNPQFVAQSDCVPVLGQPDAMLLGRCKHDGTDFWLLADPDLLNSHGLAMADNARLASALIAELAADKRVIIDLTSNVYITSRPEPRKRTWSELGRFFGYPFSVIWAGFALLSALFLWRAWIRYGPVIRLFEDQPRASKTNSIDATARLLRLSGHDRELLQSHVTARCRILATELLGPHRNQAADPVRELARIVVRKAPKLAEQLTSTGFELQNAKSDWSEAELLRRLDEFETLCERILREFGRSAGAGPIDKR